MSAINPNETVKSWKTSKPEHSVQLYVSGVEGDAGALAGARVCDFPLSLSIVPVTDWIDPEEISTAVAAVVQVDPDTPSSVKRFQKLAQSVSVPLIAAATQVFGISTWMLRLPATIAAVALVFLAAAFAKLLGGGARAAAFAAIAAGIAPGAHAAAS